MGANPTQAIGLLLFLVAFVLLAGMFAGGGMLLGLGFLVAVGAAIATFMKCKPWEHQSKEDMK